MKKLFKFFAFVAGAAAAVAAGLAIYKKFFEIDDDYVPITLDKEEAEEETDAEEADDTEAAEEE